jgi:hypothetical protein
VFQVEPVERRPPRGRPAAVDKPVQAVRPAPGQITTSWPLAYYGDTLLAAACLGWRWCFRVAVSHLG